MGSIGGIGAVQARIATIQARVGGVGTSTVNGPLSTEVAGPSNPTAGFDPFGTAYQEALAAAGIVGGATDPSDPNSGSIDLAGGSTTGSTTGSSVVPPVGAPGDGTVASFTPGELPGLGSAGGGSGGAATGTASTAASTGSSPQGYAPVAGGQATIQVYGQNPSPAAIQAANQAATQAVSQIYGTVASMTTGGTTLNGPVYTGASRLAGATSNSSGGDAYTAVSDAAFSGTGVRGASIGKIGGYGAMPVPAELQAYGNGQVPPAALESIGQGGHRLYAPAAESWKSAVAAARADGIDLKVTDSYRTYDEQVDLAGRKGLYRNGGLAAVPGTSNHGWGLAVDADATDPATLSWLRNNGYKFGFVEAVPREPWHWEYRPSQA